MRKALIVSGSHAALISLSCASDKLSEHAVRKVLGGSRVTRRRLRWVAIQAIVVTALAVVVFVTLLKPESQSPLSGISGGGDSPTIAQGPGSGPGGGGGGEGRPGQGNGNDDGDGSRGDGRDSPPTGTSSGSASGTPPVAPPTAPEVSPVRPDGGFEPQSPTTDQYADTLGALDSALR